MPRATTGRTRTRSRTTKQSVVGFIVGNYENEDGKFVKTAEEAATWLEDNEAGYSYGSLDNGYVCYVVTDKGDLKCADVAKSGFTVSLPYNHVMAESK